MASLSFPPFSYFFPRKGMNEWYKTLKKMTNIRFLELSKERGDKYKTMVILLRLYMDMYIIYTLMFS